MLRTRRRAPGVWVRCEECGRQRLELHEVTLQQCESPVSFSVTWRCGRCRRSTATVVDRLDLVRRLALAGVQRVVWQLPGELRERRPVGKPLTHDDLLDWHIRLSRPGWLEAAVAGLV